MFNSFWQKHGEKIKSIAKGAVIAGLGAGATVVLKAVADIDFGDNEIYVVAVLSVIVNILRKFGVPVVTTAVKSVM